MNTNDLQLGFDPTNQTAISGAQLAQLITTASPSSDRGMCLFTSDDSFGNPNVPNATTTIEFARYVWIRILTATNGFAVYIWNPAELGGNSGPNNTSLLYWNPIALGIIPNGSISNAQLAGGITYDKITSVQLSSIIGSNQIVQLTTPFSGTVITGTAQAGLTIAPGQVTQPMLAYDSSSGSPNAAVGTNNIIGGAVTLSKMDQTGSVGYFLISQGVGQSPVWSALGTVKLLQTVYQDTLGVTFNLPGSSTGLIGTGTQLQISKAPSFTLTAVTPAVVTSAGTSAAYQTGVPCSNSSNTAKSGGPSIAVNITPKSITSVFLVDIGMNIYLNQADQITIALYALGSASAGSVPSATATNGVITFANAGGSAINPITPLGNSADNGQAISLYNCSTGYNRINARFYVTLANTNVNILYPSVIFPFIGANLSTTSIGFNSASSTAATPLYGGGGILQSYMIVQEILS